MTQIPQKTRVRRAAEGIIRLPRKHGLPMEERIERNTFYSPCGCWYWTGTCTPQGYAMVTLNQKAIQVSRYVYRQKHNVSLSTKEFICHRCDNPMCINPDHLFVGSPKDNIHDMIKKGRNVICNPKLKEEDIIYIREAFLKEGAELLSKKYGVIIKSIQNIFHGKTWRHIPYPNKPNVSLIEGRFSSEEMKFLHDNISKMSHAEIAIALNRTRGSIISRCFRLGLKRPEGTSLLNLKDWMGKSLISKRAKPLF